MSKSLKNISVVATATVVSRILGLVREIATAAVFGTSALNSAFVSAFTLPNLFRRLLGEGGLTAAFVPSLTHELERNQRAGAFALVSKVSSWLAVVTSGLVLLSIAVLLNAPAVVRLATHVGIDVDTAGRLLLGADLAVILFPYMVFVCLAAAFSAACQVLGRFTEPAMSPIWLNLAILSALGAGAIVLRDAPAKMNLLCLGVLVGGFLQMIVPAAVLWGEGWRPRFDLRPDARVREIVRLMGPTVAGSAVYLVNLAMSRFIGLSLNDNAAAVLNLANRVMELPIGIFTAAVATVVFPLIARHAAREDWDSYAADYRKGMQFVLLLNVPAAVGLAVLSEPVTRVLFERGAFHASDTLLMAPVLAVYAISLPLVSFTSVAVRGFYAVKDTGTPVRGGVISFITNVVLSVILMRWLSTTGLALASLAAVVAQAWYLQSRISRLRPGMELRAISSSLVKILGASAAMGAVVWAGHVAVRHFAGNGKLGGTIVLLGVIPLGMLVYGGLLWALRIEGREELEQMLLRRWRRQG